MEQNFFGSEVDTASVKQAWRSLSTVSDNESNSFECNICLDSANEPVVTLCGHLYCWPCIYKWLQVQTNNISDEADHHHNCPVCKAQISHASLVPLYGRGGGGNNNSESRKPQLDLVIPRRPSPQQSHPLHHHHPNNLLPGPASHHRVTPTFHHHHHHHQYGAPTLHHHHYHHQYGGSGLYHGSGGALPPPVVMTSLISPTIGVVGEMVYARMFGGSGANLFPYPPALVASPRMRRQEVQVDKSLNRVSIFLFCCIILCLLLF